MGYIEELAAKEANRQEANRARAVQAAQVMNQNVGLADIARAQQGYGVNSTFGEYTPIDAEDRRNMVMQEQKRIAAEAYSNKVIQDAYNKAAAKQYANSKQYTDDKKISSTIPQIERYEPFRGGMDDEDKMKQADLEAAYAAEERRKQYEGNIDQGLAAKYAADRAAFR